MGGGAVKYNTISMCDQENGKNKGCFFGLEGAHLGIVFKVSKTAIFKELGTLPRILSDFWVSTNPCLGVNF